MTEHQNRSNHCYEQGRRDWIDGKPRVSPWPNLPEFTKAWLEGWDDESGGGKVDTSIEKRQARLQKNGEERERYMTKLFRVTTKLRQLEAERKRLLGPNRKSADKPRCMTLEEIRERHAAGGDEFNDEIPS